MAIDRILLTRSRRQSDAFAKQCRDALGADLKITVSPLIEIEKTNAPVVLAATDTVIFTSENGVLSLVEGTKVSGQRAFCVGQRATAAARDAGFQPAPPAADVSELVTIIDGVEDVQDLVYLRGAHVSRDIAGTLRKSGRRIREIVVYDQVALPLNNEAQSQLSVPTPLLVPVFSLRSAQLLLPSLGESLAELHIAAISPAVARAISVQIDARMEIAEQPDGASVLSALVRLSKGGDARIE